MTVPIAPSGLSATAISASEIDLAWTDNSSDETSFSVERSLNGLTGWTEVYTPAANATTQADTGLSANVGYYYRVRAHNASGYSSYSNTAFALSYLALTPVSQPRLYLLQPTTVFAARVNMASTVYPLDSITFDTVTTGAYTDVHDGMTLLLGSSAGADDYGRQRVRNEPTSTVIKVGRSSHGISDGELTVVDDAYISVWNDRRAWAKIPYITDSGTIYKDSALAVGDLTTTPPPVANCGRGYAATINSDDVIIVLLNGQTSFATADGATITGYAWDIADGTLLTGSSLTDSFIDVSFPAGFRYIALTVTDSNGKTHTAYSPIYARDPDSDTSFSGFAIDSHRITSEGQTFTIRILEDMPQATYPDGTLAMLWDREPLGAANRDHILIIGWLDTDDSTISAQRTGLLRDTTLTILDIAARMNVLPGFSQTIADDDTRDTTKIPSITWNYMVAPTMDKYMHYLLQWHSNVLDLADFVWTDTGSDYAIAIKGSDGDSLFNQVRRVADAMIPGYLLTCDRAGALYVKPVPLLQETGDRIATVQVAITEDNWSDLRFTYQRSPRTHWLRTGALVVQSSISFNSDGTVYLPTVFSIAPGKTPGQGLGETEDNEGLTASQSVLNNATGHRYARMNALYTQLVVTLIQDDSAPHSAVPWREIEPAYQEWVTLTMSASTAARRGLTFSTARCLPKEVNIRYNVGKTGMTRTVEVTLEVETIGVAAESDIKPTVPAPGDDPVPAPIPPPDSGLFLGQTDIAAIGKFGVYRTSDFDTPSSSGGPTWDYKDLTGSDEMLTWVVDPFSPGYITGTGTIDGWAASATKLYRLADLFGATPTATAVITFANTALWRTVQASFGTYFVAGSNPWLICVSYYGSTGGHTGTWATYSKDGGATWADEVLVSADYDSGGAVNPIGLYTSPKTAGLAYTIAHTETANPATAGGYISTDWGATWTALTSSEDPSFPLPRWGTFDDDDVWTQGDRAPSATVEADNNGGSGDSTVVATLAIAPPANTKRITISGVINAIAQHTGLGSASYAFSSGVSGVSRTVISDTNNGMTGYGQSYVRNFTYQYDFSNWATQDWPHNRDLVEADGSVVLGDLSIRLAITAGATVHAGNTSTISIACSVDEIILDDSTTYTPTAPGILLPKNGMSGEIHLPWESNAAEDVFYSGQLDRSGNRQFALIRAVSGTVDDISPNDGSIDYGINAGHFSLRAHDSDRTLVLAAVTGNDASSSSSGDKQGVYFSDDAGDTWTEVVAPATGTEVYQAAFSGSLDGVVYIFGPAEYMGYSEDNGASVDSRAGNLSALSATKLIGLAGGPTG